LPKINLVERKNCGKEKKSNLQLSRANMIWHLFWDEPSSWKPAHGTWTLIPVGNCQKYGHISECWDAKT
jgi:hypothetical protein